MILLIPIVLIVVIIKIISLTIRDANFKQFLELIFTTLINYQL